MTPERFNVATVFDRDTLLHLRLPFSFFLLPVFCFGISQASNIHATTTIIVFIALHFFIYPGSNIYNSYMDKDTGSIGGLEHPPPATPKLYYASIIVDIAGLLLCALAGWQHMLVMAGYIAFSKAYSWYGIRLKKYAILGWLSVMFFQGGYTFMLANMTAVNNVSLQWFTPKNLECMTIASLLIGGSYPLTQIYQHEEDGERGDHTISYKLGIKGTFIFSGIFFFLGALVTLHYFLQYYTVSQFFIFLICLSPVIIYFQYWFIKSMKDRAFVNYKQAMLMNKIASACMVLCFSIILSLNLYLSA